MKSNCLHIIMLEKFLFICLIIFNSQKLIRSDFIDEFDLISWQKNGTSKEETVPFIDTPYIVLNSDIKKVDGKYILQKKKKFIWSDAVIYSIKF